MYAPKIKWKRKRTLAVLQFTNVWYLFWEFINSAKLYKNTSIGSSIRRLEVLIC